MRPPLNHEIYYADIIYLFEVKGITHSQKCSFVENRVWFIDVLKEHPLGLY